eukprot:scaffold179150_cov17-Tisochrysis_lutea.AAC.2
MPQTNRTHLYQQSVKLISALNRFLATPSQYWSFVAMAPSHGLCCALPFGTVANALSSVT